MKGQRPHDGTNDQTDERPTDESLGTVIPFRPRKPADPPVFEPDPDGPTAA